MDKVERAYVQVDECSGHGAWFDRGELEFLARETERSKAEANAETALSPGARLAKTADRVNSELEQIADRVVAQAIAEQKDDGGEY